MILNDKNSENKRSLKSQTVILNEKDGRGFNIKYLPYVFTEQGVAMLSSVLKSRKAIEINIIIMRAFVKIRNLVYNYKELADKIGKIEREQGGKISRIFEILNKMMKEEERSKEEIGFKG